MKTTRNIQHNMWISNWEHAHRLVYDFDRGVTRYIAPIEDTRKLAPLYNAVDSIRMFIYKLMH